VPFVRDEAEYDVRLPEDAVVSMVGDEKSASLSMTHRVEA